LAFPKLEVSKVVSNREDLGKEAPAFELQEVWGTFCASSALGS